MRESVSRQTMAGRAPPSGTFRSARQPSVPYQMKTSRPEASGTSRGPGAASRAIRPDRDSAPRTPVAPAGPGREEGGHAGESGRGGVDQRATLRRVEAHQHPAQVGAGPSRRAYPCRAASSTPSATGRQQQHVATVVGAVDERAEDRLLLRRGLDRPEQAVHLACARAAWASAPRERTRARRRGSAGSGPGSCDGRRVSRPKGGPAAWRPGTPGRAGYPAATTERSPAGIESDRIGQPRVEGQGQARRQRQQLEQHQDQEGEAGNSRGARAGGPAQVEGPGTSRRAFSSNTTKGPRGGTRNGAAQDRAQPTDGERALGQQRGQAETGAPEGHVGEPVYGAEGGQRARDDQHQNGFESPRHRPQPTGSADDARSRVLRWCRHRPARISFPRPW